MKIFKLTFYIGLLASLSILNQAIKGQDQTSTGYTKTLTWSDEFNTDGVLDSRYWDYELGYIRNSELQYYTNNPKNVRKEGGYLILQAIKEKVNNYDYTSASVITKNKISFSGDFRIEVRAKLPKGGGVWPAIWMMGAVGKWPNCSELDIMEYVGSDPFKIFATMHWAEPLMTKRNVKKGTNIVITDDVHDNFNLYGLERIGSNIKVFFNDNYYFDFDVPSAAVPNSFVQPVFLLMNLAMGGQWAGSVDESQLPFTYTIDYVRVYALSKTPAEGIENIKIDNEIFIFKEKSILALKKANFEVFDFVGRRIIKKYMNGGDNFTLPTGVYIVKASDLNSMYCNKIINIH